MTEIVLLLAASYILGGIPSGYLIARSVKGIDIREHGSGNPGAANVYRIVGKWAGWGTMLGDSLKGFVPVTLAIHFYPDNYWLAIACGIMAIISHMWSIFLKFRGGKGVATSLGVFAALLPVPTLIAFVVFVVSVALSGHISVGSIVAGVTLPIVSFAMGKYPLPFLVTVSLVSALIIVRHIPNIKRLIKNQELAFEDGTKRDPKELPAKKN
ncbi:MAG: glycerol-3-phosphate 1-O-acyltransferase PlsY [Elusimicrobiaceae bacterium]|nr:glycerol-3-phosphate 1-O-acyltransferase PlsY [Elusimicrobiaceae bacterium]